MDDKDSLIKGRQYRHVEGLPVDDILELVGLLEAEYLKLGRQTKYRKKDSFAPSGIGYGNSTCARYWYHAFEGCVFDESETSAKNIASMEAGTDSGKRLAKLFKSAGVANGTEVEFRIEDPPIHGFMDVVVDWKGNEFPIEIKTTRQEMFTTRETSMKPTLYNLFQILIYMKALNKKVGLLLYENKNDQTLVPIPVGMTPYNEKLLEDALNWLRLVYKTIQDKQVPNRGFPTRRNKNCRNCPVRAACWSDSAPESTVIIPLMSTPRL